MALINLNDTTPAAPAGKVNIKWQADAGSPRNVSAYIDPPPSPVAESETPAGTLNGSISTVSVSDSPYPVASLMLVGNYGFEHKVVFQDPAQLALALGPIAGNFVRNGILLLMVNAAVLGTTAISLASAWAYGEVHGWEHSLHKKLWEAPGFYATYIACVGAAAAIVLIPRVPLQLVIISVQVFAGLILPSAIIFLQLLLNDHELLGDRWVNRPWNNYINWTIIIVLFALSLLLAAQVMFPNLF